MVLRPWMLAVLGMIFGSCMTCMTFYLRRRTNKAGYFPNQGLGLRLYIEMMSMFQG